ncbi:MAG: hypothetical protein R3202_10205, partial [Candidatus Competibacterales bacterium]|nr:hypothetical protein [Candidatus Competibacterales bacterium]
GGAGGPQGGARAHRGGHAGLAACCHAVYHDATTARSAYRELGWTLQQRIERAGVRADWLTRKDCRLLVCCGTRAREIGNLRYDADTILVHYALGGRVHRGFLRAFETLAANFDGRIGGGGLPWFAVGHSLGGALAILAAAHWQAAGVVAFGCPRVGDPDFVAAIAALPVLRYQNGCDLVGHLPPQRLGFAHVGLLRYRVPGDGIIDAPEAGRLRRSQRRAKLRYALGLPWFRPGAIWFRELADHAIHNYAKVLRCR